MMRNIIVLAVSVFLLTSCNRVQNVINDKTKDDDIWLLIEKFLADGAEVFDVRPDAGIVSEKEILVKIAKIAAADGYLNLNHPLYSTDNPKLATARIEAPILVHDLTVPVQDVYKASSYLLNAVDDRGETLLSVYVDPSASSTDDLYGPISVTPKNGSVEMSRHFITRREAKEIIESQFPGQEYEGPIAVSMLFDGDPYSMVNVSWYFTVGNSFSRSVANNEHKEYLINASVHGYRELPDKVTVPASRSVIDSQKSIGGFTFHSRMVQLVEPINFFDKLNGIKEGRSVTNAGPPAPARVFPVPLN
ncbi:hypothetical protein FACS189450_07270 [Spirochaetia bacterium]|nr:hypothetical protein FACS189450_07270 [Spirochaetia bacterium]